MCDYPCTSVCVLLYIRMDVKRCIQNITICFYGYNMILHNYTEGHFLDSFLVLALQFMPASHVCYHTILLCPQTALCLCWNQIKIHLQVVLLQFVLDKVFTKWNCPQQTNTPEFLNLKKKVCPVMLFTYYIWRPGSTRFDSTHHLHFQHNWAACLKVCLDAMMLLSQSQFYQRITTTNVLLLIQLQT